MSFRNVSRAEAINRETLDIQKRALGPEHAETLHSIYILAWMAALQGERTGAFRYLSDAVDHGFSNVEGLLGGSNLESLRGDPEFKRIVAVANENQKRTARGRPPGPRSHEVRIPLPPSKEP